jgi:hypothetical protein
MIYLAPLRFLGRGKHLPMWQCLPFGYRLAVMLEKDADVFMPHVALE